MLHVHNVTHRYFYNYLDNITNNTKQIYLDKRYNNHVLYLWKTDNCLGARIKQAIYVKDVINYWNYYNNSIIPITKHKYY